MIRWVLVCSMTLPTTALALDVTTGAARKKNLLEYVAERDDLTSTEKAAWDRAVRLTFGGKALKDGTDEGVTVAKSVISGAIFFGVEPKRAAKAAYEAYHDTYRWVPPPLAINYQLLALQGQKPSASSRELAFNFPRYFNEELAPDLVAWWDEMIRSGAIDDLQRPDVERLLGETRRLMRPMLLERLWQAAQIEARGGSGELNDIAKELQRSFRGVGAGAVIHDRKRSYYDRYRALASELGVAAQPQPKAAVVKRPKAKPRKPPAVVKKPKKRPPRGFAQRKPRTAGHKPKGQAQIPVPLGRESLVAAASGWHRALNTAVDRWSGTPYVFGGTSRQGVDCSAFSRAVFREALDIELPRNSRAQYRTGKGVKRKTLKAGDLVFFDTLDRGQVTHVGVFLGAGTFAHASSSRGVTRAQLGKRYYQRAYWGSRRVVRP